MKPGRGESINNLYPESLLRNRKIFRAYFNQFEKIQRENHEKVQNDF